MYLLFIRFLAALLITTAVVAIRAASEGNMMDLTFPWCGWQAYWRGENPYLACNTLMGTSPLVMNPFTTSLILAPLSIIPHTLRGLVFVGVSTALLAWGLTAHGRWWRLLLFVSPMFIVAIRLTQWSPLFCAALLLPWLMPVVIAKPQNGLVVALMGRWSWRTVGVTIGLVLLSLLLLPMWPIWYLRYGNLSSYVSFIPLLTLPFGPLLALAACRITHWRARLLLVLACVPQRMYDPLALLFIPQSWRSLALMLVVGWLPVFFFPPILWREATIYGVGLSYAVALPLVWWRV